MIYDNCSFFVLINLCLISTVKSQSWLPEGFVLEEITEVEEATPTPTQLHQFAQIANADEKEKQVVSSSVPSPDWTVYNYPHPTLNYATCGLTSPGYVCDPDSVLSEADRTRLNDAIVSLRDVTIDRRQIRTCRKSGYHPYVAIARKIKRFDQSNPNITDSDVQHFTDFLSLSAYIPTLDCRKSSVTFLVESSGSLWTHAHNETGIGEAEVTEAFEQNAQLFSNNHLSFGLSNILQYYADKFIQYNRNRPSFGSL